MKRIALIDADTFVYHAATAVETVVEFDEEVAVTADKGEGIRVLEEALTKVEEKLGVDEMVIALTDYDNPNFRKAILPTYKSHRGKKPILLPVLRRHLIETRAAKIKPTLEADDVLGILMTNDKLLDGAKRVCVSIDKDLRTIPGWHFNPDKDTKPVKVAEVGADEMHLFQTLVGDKTDGYAGCPGVGPVKAQRIIAEAIDRDAHLSGTIYQCVWPHIVAAFEANGLTADDALVQARVARILRSSDYDYSSKRPILWQPPASST